MGMAGITNDTPMEIDMVKTNEKVHIPSNRDKNNKRPKTRVRQHISNHRITPGKSPNTTRANTDEQLLIKEMY